MPTVKIFVAGLSKSGKTETIKGISDIPIVSIAKRLLGTGTEIQMEYGRVHIDRYMLYFYAPQSPAELSISWDGLKGEVDALIFLISGSRQGDVAESLATFETLTKDWGKPVVLGVSGLAADTFDETVVHTVSAALAGRFSVIPFNALHRESARGVAVGLTEVVAKYSAKGERP